MQIESFKRTDPATKKHLAVPVEVPNYIFRTTRNSTDRRMKAVGEMTLVAFYFLLRVGEYTHHGNGQRRTQQFRLQDIRFFTKDRAIPLEQLHQDKDQVALVALTIDNQKNGRRGEVLSHHALAGDNICCPVRALVLRVLDLLKDGARPDTLLCAFRDSPKVAWQHVRSNDILITMKRAVPLCSEYIRNYDVKKIGTHSLRSGGAMALYMNKRDALTIQRAGRWTSNTFLEYIHSQLDVSSKGLAQSMSKATPFLNMA